MTTTNTETAPTIHFQLLGNERGQAIIILDGHTMSGGSGRIEIVGGQVDSTWASRP